MRNGQVKPDRFLYALPREPSSDEEGGTRSVAEGEMGKRSSPLRQPFDKFVKKYGIFMIGQIE